MAHGLAGVKEMRLDAFAERFAAAGYHVLVFDYRHFGDSHGHAAPAVGHQEAAPGLGRRGRLRRSRHEVDASGIVLWGSSLSGGHVLAVAERVGASAVISQVPHVDGPASTVALGPAQALKLTGTRLLDAVRGADRRAPHYLPASGTPGATGLDDRA